MYPKQLVDYIVDMPKNFDVKRIAFLGGAMWKPEDKTYQDASDTAKLLAENGYEILNGGGPGVMEASTRGAQAGGQKDTLVVTFHPSGTHKNYEDASHTNPYTHEIMTIDYFDRTKILLQNTDVHIVFKGGTGTISEFGMTWASSRIHEGHHKPIILFGEFWNTVIQTLIDYMHMRPGEINLLKICNTPEEVLTYIKSIDTKAVSQG